MGEAKKFSLSSFTLTHFIVFMCGSCILVSANPGGYKRGLGPRRLSIADLIHRSYQNIFPELNDCCPMSMGRFDGDNTTRVSSSTRLVRLHYVNASRNSSFPCVGTIICKSFVLTAAHCVTGEFVKNLGNLSYVRLGHDIALELQCHNNNCTKLIIDKKIGEVIVHEGYNDTTRENDIALIKFANPLATFTSQIEPMCLRWVHKPSPRELSSKEKYAILGCESNLYAQQNYSLTPSEQNITLYDRQQCSEEYSRVNRRITESHICGVKADNQRTCGGSAGPLISYIDNCPVLEGIMSFRKGWRNIDLPEIFTDIMAYEKWIEKNILG